MSKRALTPVPLPPAKRLHTAAPSIPYPPQLLSFENSLYDELILCIFSHLSWVDLCVTQATSKKWARLAADNELWRKQYLRVYCRTRLRGAKGFIGRLDGREVRPLPGRARADQYKDWKWMFRISSNWRKGMYKIVLIFSCRLTCYVVFRSMHCGDKFRLSSTFPSTRTRHTSRSFV